MIMPGSAGSGFPETADIETASDAYAVRFHAAMDYSVPLFGSGTEIPA